MPVLQGDRVTLRPIAEADLEPLAAIIREPSVAAWWGESGEPERLRENLSMDGDAWAIETDGELAGWLGFTEETEPEYRSVGLDISLADRFQGQGLGPDALRTAIRWFADRARPPPLHDRPERGQRAGDQAPTPRSASSPSA